MWCTRPLVAHIAHHHAGALEVNAAVYHAAALGAYTPLRRWSVGHENIGNADSTSRRTLNRRMHS